jgi:hypothetical protein
MPVNRILGMLQEPAAQFAGAELAQVNHKSSFVAFPLGFAPTVLQEQLYRSAWERARQSVAPVSRGQRDVIVWN